MKILLVGYGKMGKAIEAIAVNHGHEIGGKIDIQTGEGFNASIKADVAIEFTQPESAVDNIKHCLDLQIPVVVGTTGWYHRFEEVADYCRKKDGTVFYASNFSMGVNVFFKLNEYLAKLMDRYPDYEVSIDETHHTQKKDAPSGTAITLAESLIKNIERKKRWVNHATTHAEELMINSFRVDPAPGTHVVTYHSAIDDIEIKHHAYSREGFARGAVLVAEWLPGHKGMLSMDDFLRF
jgi:4-hydroxy-tetrahydrodipicolinate reductase